MLATMFFAGFRKKKDSRFDSGNNLPAIKSSISDDSRYPDFCRLAAQDSRVFAEFRRDPRYTAILEHVNEAQGREYLQRLSRTGKARNFLDEAARNDRIGNPHRMTLDSGIRISPTTLRYLKVADDLETLFGNLDGARICEIGVGYGGQCRILDSIFNIDSYALVDLRPVLQLVDRFLNQFPLHCKLHYSCLNELGYEGYDLIISNYAFSELDRDVQERYFHKVIANSYKGYMAYNEISPPEMRSMSRVEFCERVNGSILPERPLTHPNNCIIV